MIQCVQISMFASQNGARSILFVLAYLAPETIVTTNQTKRKQNKEHERWDQKEKLNTWETLKVTLSICTSLATSTSAAAASSNRAMSLLEAIQIEAVWRDNWISLIENINCWLFWHWTNIWPLFVCCQLFCMKILIIIEQGIRATCQVWTDLLSIMCLLPDWWRYNQIFT